MRKGSNRQNTEMNYWESMADILVSLLLCVLLIVLLLILYLVRIPDEEYVDDAYGNRYTQYDDADDGGGNYGYPQATNDEHYRDYDYREPDDDYGGGGGGWGGWEPRETVTPEVTVSVEPTATIGPGQDKTAVFVQVVDGETQSTIKQKGVEFELYSTDDMLQTLSVYYPVRIDYTRYETNEDGVFYLPEKLMFGSYYLHGLTAIKGYDTSENTEFTIDESRDWPEPFVVTVELYPSRNVIRVQLKDRDSGKSISGGAFNVIASTDIVTMDGTTRYHAGQIVDTIELDEQGYGESVQLYLGTYRLEQTSVPEYYAALEEQPTVALQKSSATGRQPTTELTQQKTAIELTLTDALNRVQGLEGVEFTLSGGGAAIRRAKTDENGRIRFEDLRANTTYRVRQVNALKNYSRDSQVHSLQVDGRGYINGSAEATLSLTNEMVRVAIGIKGKLFSGLQSDVNAALYTADDELVKIWNSTAIEESFEGLTPGAYKIVINGKLESAMQIQVRQTEEVQHFYCQIWTTGDIGAICGAAALGVALIVLMVFLIHRRRRKN